MPATPIMRWLHDVDGPVDQFNQTMVVQTPAGVTEADVVVVVQALLDRHAMLRCASSTTARGGGHCRCPSRGGGRARVCAVRGGAQAMRAVGGARSRLDPAAGVTRSRASTDPASGTVSDQPPAPSPSTRHRNMACRSNNACTSTTTSAAVTPTGAEPPPSD